MKQLLVTVVLLVALTTIAIAQAPEAADPNTQPKKAVRKKGAKIPAMVLRAKKTASSREIPDIYKGRILSVGSGGGIRGQETAYYLLDDGRLFSRKTGQTSYAIIGKQTPGNTKKVFVSAEDRCAIRKTTYSKPGNIYRFVGWKKGAETHKVTWAPGDKAVPPNFDQVYTGFMGMLPADKK